MKLMKRIIPLVICAAMLLPCYASADGTESGTEDNAVAETSAESISYDYDASDITKECTIYCNGGLLAYDMQDSSYFTRGRLGAGSVLKAVCNSKKICGVYIRFDQTGKNEYPGTWTLETDDGIVRECGQNQYQQQYVGDFSSNSVTITFSTDVGISDIYFISEGNLPSWVHNWGDAPEKVDILLMACHSDDDQYTFTGLIPWALAQGIEIHVSYFINHYTHPNRVHELLDGLWESGLHNYPTLGEYRDEEHDTTLQSYINTGYTEEDLLGTIVKNYRRFEPQVIVVHATNGEYGHGAHVLYSALCLKAAEMCGDESLFPDTAAEYGVWDIPKIYVHCYSENQVVLDFDTPLDMFGGRTAYKVGQDAFMYEVSQTWYSGQMGYMYSQTRAVDVSRNRPCDYGLYRSLVGADTNNDTLMDNIVLWMDKERVAAEQAEAERIAAEEEAKRLAEEAARAEAEAQKEEDVKGGNATADAEAALAESRERADEYGVHHSDDSKIVIFGGLGVALALALVVTLSIVFHNMKNRRKRRRAKAAARARAKKKPENEDYDEE